MKTSRILVGIFALAAVVACSNPNEENQVNLPTDGANKSYLALNLKSANDGSRLADATYEDGTADEQAITTATFYFFDAAGNSFPVNANGNYYNVSVADNGGKETPNIESMSDPVLVIEKYKGEFPAQIVAVVNYTGNTSLSLTQLKDQMQAAGHTNGKNFIMTNSAYVDGAGEAIYATALTIDHFQTTADKAIANPVTIYVERMTAKLTVLSNEAAYNTGVKLNNKDVYAKVLSWDVIGAQTESYYIKTIDPTWTEANLGFVWNDAPFFRSYWSAKSVTNPVENDFNFSQLTNPLTTVEYLGELIGARAKVVVAATLQDADGNALEIAQWYGTNYVGEDALLAAVAPTLKNKFVQLVGTTYTSIDDSQLQLVAGLATAESYEVSFQLADGVQKDNWYSFDGTTYTAIADVNAELAKVEPAKVWKSGMTYYYTDVKHLGSAGTVGEYGIVRNHSYKVNVSGVKGWGTPVYDPEQKVDPVKPTDKETYIAAEINVLSWRVVSNDATLE